MFDKDALKYSNKYRDVLRRQMFATFKIRLVVSTCYTGKLKTAVTTKCEKCKQFYKLYGRILDLSAAVATTFTVRSSNEKFCNCLDLIEPRGKRKSIKLKKDEKKST